MTLRFRVRHMIRFAGLCLTLALAGTPSLMPVANAEAPFNLVHIATQSNGQCDVGENASTVRGRQVNLVLDDSGSMFSTGQANSPLDRWSAAKYSLEVFAAMLAEDDKMSVYLLSDFGATGSKRPALQLKGTQTLSDRVAKVHEMKLAGGGTPYAPVEAAVADLQASSAVEKWLVVLSDGAFDEPRVKEPADLQAELEGFVAANNTSESMFNVAFLALGNSAPDLTNSPSSGVYFSKAAGSADLLGVMTGFANQIFGRSALPESVRVGPQQANIDIALDELMIFAQGANVTIGELHTSEGTQRPTSSVVVQWAPNPDVAYGQTRVPAVPNESLKGTLAVFEDVPAGNLTVDVAGAQTIDFFYRPKVAFGVKLRNADGIEIDSDKAVAGSYTVTYGFMDDACNFVESALFGNPQFTARVVQNGEPIAETLTSGDQLQLERGTITMDVRASYLDDSTSQQQLTLKVLQAGKPTAFDIAQRDYYVSKLVDYSTPADATQLHYFVNQDGIRSEFTQEEWAAITDSSFSITSPIENIEFDVKRGQNPGEVFVLPKAPGGDVYRAAAGDVPFTISASFVFDEQPSTGMLETSLTIIDDISWLDRFTHWFLDVGWKWLLALLAFLWILGYFLRRRLPRKLQAKPLVTFRPKSVGGKRAQFAGRFEKSRGRQLIPYLPEKGTIAPAPQMRGMPALKVKAAGSGRMEVLNWKAAAQSGKVSFDSALLTKEVTKIKPLRAASKISVQANDGAYEMQLNQTISRGKKR